MMSARPSRSISSRMAGVSAVWGTAPPYHSRPCQRPSAARHTADRPLLRHLAGVVAAVRRLIRQAVEALRLPRPDPRHDRRPDEGPDPDEVRFAEHALEDAPALEQRDVDKRRVVEPEEVRGHIADVVIDVEVARRERVLSQLQRVHRAIAPETDER